MNLNKSKKAFQQAVKSIPGGVNSPARAYKNVKEEPIFFEKARGSRMWDIDGNEFIDYVGSWGPMVLGHAHEGVLENLERIMKHGTSFGTPTEIETGMAELIKNMVPSVDLVRMVNSGTEATMSALRLARGYTGRNFVIKFEGCYHGHGDSFLIKAGSGALTHGNPDSPGVTPGTAGDTLMASYNDLESVKALFQSRENEIAAVILEPVTGNMGVIAPKTEFLQGLRDLCHQHDAVLIFDEVMTGFRLSRGGAQELYGIRPDLTAFGKIIGGGLPVGAYGGKKEIMEMLAPDGPVYQAGTLSGNPLAMQAGYTTLRILNENDSIYDQLAEKTGKLAEGIRNNLKTAGVEAMVNQVGSMFTLFFTENTTVESFGDVMSCNTDLFARYFSESLQRGIYYPPSQFEANFVSLAHSDKDIEFTIEKNREALKGINKE